MGERWQRFTAEVGRFLAVGLLATIVALLIFNLLVHGYGALDDAPLNKRPVLAYVLANGVGMAISFFGTRSWAFRDREARHADGGVTAFVSINFATMLIPMACLWISRNLLGLDDPISDNVSANVIGLLLANVARFFLFRSWVFRHPPGAFPIRLGAAEIEEELRGPTSRSRIDRARPPAP
ncbi:GtrA family protein [Nocardioides sp. GCM10027113]|uniref:GtrA family protein n=1 Tax=unclassified Nocardioides TaxID=2615069 RepID=UPI0036086BDD